MQLLASAQAMGLWQHRDEIARFVELIAHRPIHNVIEIGALHGGSALLWAGLSTGKVVSIDLPMGEFGGHAHGITSEVAKERAERLKTLNPRIISVLGDSHDPDTWSAVGQILDYEGVDLLFIDGDHSLEGVRQDYEMYQPFVVKGGIIAFHDINETPLHIANSCFVHEFWKQLRVESAYTEISIGADWGGIGVIYK